MERRISEEKEREVAKLREMQEKAADRQADIDALRAKRAYEQQERDNRLKEKLEFDKKMRLLNDLEESRRKQFQDKQRALHQQATEEREEFLKIIHNQKETEDKERKLTEQRKTAFQQHSEELMLQIQFNSETKKQKRLDFLEEGRRLRVGQADEILKLETIKSNKLRQLYDMGIDKKYVSALERNQVSIQDKLRNSK